MTQFSSRLRFARPADGATEYDLASPEAWEVITQTNPTNPILVDFRTSNGDARLWLDVITSSDGDTLLATTPRAWGDIASAHIAHAIRVLTRLVSLTG